MPTQNDIATHLGLNQSEVSRHMAALNLDWKTVGLDVIRLAYIKQIRSEAAGHKSQSGLDLTHERALTEQVDRHLKQLTLAEKQGQLVNLAQLEPELLRMVAAFRTEMMSRDDKLKSEIDALYGIDLDLTFLNEHTRNALAQLSRYDAERARAAQEVDQPGGAAGGDDYDTVGADASANVRQSDGAAWRLQP